MCYNFATFVLYLDVITLIYRENRLTSSETSLSARKHTKSESYPERLTLFLFYGCYFFVVCNFVICNMLQALLPKKYPISTTWHTLLRVLISRCNVLCTLSLCSKNQAKISGKLFDIYRHVSVTYRWLTGDLPNKELRMLESTIDEC